MKNNNNACSFLKKFGYIYRCTSEIMEIGVFRVSEG